MYVGERSFVLGQQGPFACWGPRCHVWTIKKAVRRAIKGKKKHQVQQVPRHWLLTLPARVLGCKVQKGSLCKLVWTASPFCVAVCFVVIPVEKKSVNSLGLNPGRSLFFFFS